MARVAGIDLPKNKRIEVALTYIFGIGHSRAKKIIETTQVDPNVRVKDLTEGDLGKLIKAVNMVGKIEGDLRREVTFNIKRLMEIGCYRGMRHRKGLPLRGQRTRTNARTRKGRKTTVGRSKKTV
jgi:small subunit ribosomal protein S13